MEVTDRFSDLIRVSEGRYVSQEEVLDRAVEVLASASCERAVPSRRANRRQEILC